MTRPYSPVSSDAPTRNSSTGSSRRDLLKALMGGLAGTTAAPGLFGAPQHRANAVARPGLKDDVKPLQVWNVKTSSGSGGTGLASFGEGKLTYLANASGGGLTIKDVQRGDTALYLNEIFYKTTPRIVNGVVYCTSGFDVVGYDLSRPYPSPRVLDYSANLYTEINSFGGMLVFAEKPVLGGNCQITLLDTATQQPVWKCDTGLTVSMFSIVPPAVFAGGIILARVRDALLAIDSGSGQLLWSHGVGNYVNQTDWGICTDSAYVYVISGGVLHALDLATGSPVWQSATGTGLASAAAYNGYVYAGDSVGNLNVFVAGRGNNGQAVPAYAPVRLDSDLTRSPIYIEDGVAYLASERSLYAVDLASQGQKIVSYDEGIGPKLIGVENGVCYVTHNSDTEIAAVDMANQLHQYFCTSQLMADDYTASETSPNGAQPTSTWYRTQVKLVDLYGAPRANKSVKLTVSDNATIQSGGQTTALTPDQPLWLTADGAGEVTITVQATDLSCPALQLWGNFMDTHESIVIYPDHDNANTLSQTQGTDLSAATAYDGTPLLPAGYTGAADLAQGIRRMMGNSPANVTSTARHGTEGLTHANNKYTAYPDATNNLLYQPVAGPTERGYVPAGNGSWSMTFGSRAATLADSRGVQATGAQVGSIFTDIKDSAKNVVHGAEKAADITWTDLQNTASVVIHTLENTYELTVSAVEHALTIVAGVLKTVIEDLKKAWEWLSYIFHWNDIVANKRRLKAAVDQWFTDMEGWSGDLVKGVQKSLRDEFTEAEDAIRKQLNNVVNSLGGSTAQSSQINHNSPSGWVKGAEKDVAKWFSAMRWITSKVQEALPSAPSPIRDQVPASFTPFRDTVQKLIDDSAAKIAADPDLKNIGQDLEQFSRDFAKMFSSSQQAMNTLTADFVQLIGDVFLILVEAVYLVLDAAIEVLPSLFGAIHDLLNLQISIPGVATLWKAISKDPLTVMDLMALMIAVPVTVIDKIRGGSLNKLAASAGDTLFSDSTWWLIASEISLTLTALQDSLGTEQVTALNWLLIAANAVIVVANAPVPISSVTSHTAWLLSMGVWFVISGRAVYTPAKGAGPKPKEGQITAVIALNFLGGNIQAGYALYQFIAGGDASSAAVRSMLASVFSAIPLIAKPLRNFEPLAPLTLTLAGIDVAFKDTSIGLQLSLQTA